MVAPRNTSMGFSRGDAGDKTDAAADGNIFAGVSRRHGRGGSSIVLGEPNRPVRILLAGPVSQGSTSMAPSEITCPKCKKEMQEGFVTDNSYTHAIVGRWIEGGLRVAGLV